MPVTLDRPYRLSRSVALRPEPFGALAYNYVNRRLVFLRSPDIVRVVEALGEAPDTAAALAAAGIARERHPSFLAALDSLAEAGVIETGDSDAGR
jgi:putative mycofactocin binding protein MftB